MSNPNRQTWTKSHPLEGDGLLVNFYNHMQKQNKNFLTCPGLRCPDTVVYDHNFPRGWYTYDPKNKELKKKQGKELDTSSINQAFSKNSDSNVDIVASYLYSYETDAGETITCVEFFTKEDLGDFLNNRKTKKEGILQKFLVPKGLSNSLIQAVWSPRVCIVQRKTNRHAITDRSYTPYERAVTYEGPSHYTEDGICAPKTTAQIKTICGHICQHFQDTEHKTITRMVLYFKVDKNDQVWILWCGSIRIADRLHSTVRDANPLNLSPIFTSPEQSKVNRESSFDGGELQVTDQQQFKLSGDKVFQMTHCSKPAKKRSGRESPTSPTQAGAPRNQEIEDREPSMSEDLMKGSMSHNTNSNQEVAPGVQTEWYKLDPRIHEQYKQLRDESELVSQVLDDVFYEAYSHFLQHNSGAFFFALPTSLKGILGNEHLEQLLTHLKIQPVPDAELAKQAQEGNVSVEMGMDFWIPDMQHQPISKLGVECRQWLQTHYAKKEESLKRQCTISMGALGEDDVLNSYSIQKVNRKGGKAAPAARETPSPTEEREATYSSDDSDD